MKSFPAPFIFVKRSMTVILAAAVPVVMSSVVSRYCWIIVVELE
jgi:hypothetical protein